MVALSAWVETALDLLWVGWILYWVGAPLYERVRGRSKKVVRRGRGTLLSFVLLMGSFAVLQVTFTGNLAFLSAGVPPENAPLLIAGFGLALVGLALSIWARAHLGSNWSPSAMMKKDQALVKTGPYAIVRNPIYLGLTVAMTGTGVVFGGDRVLVSLALILLFSWVRIRGEEKLLSDQFGQEYATYKEDVRAFIPGIL
jgi:protein-S-isoprenylcysteine O-methyltransferase Ste14